MVYLPDELWLHILSLVPPAVTWTNCLFINRQLHRLVETYARDELLPRFKIGLTTSLSSGSHHRWYDVWGTITFRSPQLKPCSQPCVGSASNYALFAEYEASPPKLEARMLLKWRTLAASDYRASDRPREWKVQFGVENVDVKLLTKVEYLDVTHGYGVWIDWRELLGQYWATRIGNRSAVDDASSYARTIYF